MPVPGPMYAASMLALIDRASNEVVQRGDRLASAPMADECGPALLPGVEALELRSRSVRDLDPLLVIHLGFPRRLHLPSSPAKRC